MTHPNNFVSTLQAYQPGKPISELEREFGISDCIKLASNENPLGPAPSVIEALKAELKNLHVYPDTGSYFLRIALAEHLQVKKEWLTFGNGSHDVIDILIRSYVDAGKEVIGSQYGFAIYKLLTQIAGGTFVEVPAKNWGVDLAAMLAAITPKTVMICIANPNNPTGSYLPLEVLETFVKQVPDHIVILLDEAYVEYLANDQMTTLVWVQKYPNLILARTFSKAYGLAGLRVGYSISQKPITDTLHRVRQPFSLNNLAEVAAIHALKATGHLAQTVMINRVGRKRLEQCFSELDLVYIPSAANFVTVDCGRPAAGVYAQLLQYGVITRHLVPYAMPYHLRVSTGTPEQMGRFCHSFTGLINKSPKD